MTSSRRRFRDAYRHSPPWDVPFAQPALCEVVNRLHGRLLDAGCGTGENAIYMAERGCDVVGLDFTDAAITAAKHKAASRNVPGIRWEVADARELTERDWQFDSIVDCGLYHCFDPQPRQQYLAGLRHVAAEGCLLMLLCFSDREPEGKGPRRVSREELDRDFSDGWTIEAVDAVVFAVRDDLPEGYFSPGGPHAWRLLARRTREQ